MASKVSAFGLQLLSLPLVFRTLDSHAYAVFLLVSAVLSTLQLTQMGTGPGLTQEIAKASALNRHESESIYFASGLVLCLTIVTVAGGALLLLLHYIPIELLLGQDYAGDRDLIVSTGNVCIALVCAHILFANADSALAGYQEQAYTSVGTLISNVTSAVLIIWVCQTRPSVTEIIWATFGPPTAVRIVNFVLLLWRRPYLLAGLRQTSIGSVKHLVGAGLAYWLIQISSVIEQNAGYLILGHLASPSDLSVYGFVYRAILLALSAVSIVTQPLWPAYIDARVRRDFEWIKRRFVLSRRICVAFAVVLALGLVAVGPQVFVAVLHVDLGENSRLLLSIFGLYSLSNIWAHLYYYALLGLDRVWTCALVIIIETAVAVVAGLALTPLIGIAGMAAAHFIASLTVPVWYLPLLLNRTISGLTN